MRKEFLEDYERKEIELQREYYRKILKLVPEKSKVGYPSPSRFKKYNEPGF